VTKTTAKTDEQKNILSTYVFRNWL